MDESEAATERTAYDDQDSSREMDTSFLPHCTLDEDELDRIFQAKCEDGNIRYEYKLFRRFVKHQTKKPFIKLFEMDNCAIGPIACNSVAEVVFNHPSIRAISLSGNNLGDAGCMAFADLILQSDRIIALDLSGNGIGEQGASTLFQGLSHNHTVFSVKMGSTSAVGRNSFGLTAIEDLRMMLEHNVVLAELDLSMSEISPEYVDVFSKGLSVNHSLQVLTLNTNNIQSKGAIAILSCCRHGQIRELNLAANHLRDDVGRAFADFLAASKTIRSLDLSGNNLTARFTGAIAVPLAEVSDLEELDLSQNPLGGKGIAALGPAVASCRKLLVLSVVQCKIEADGFIEFCNDLEKNHTLTKLRFGHNPLRDRGTVGLAPVIEAHPALKDVDLELCEIGDVGAAPLFPALALSPAIVRFSVKNNLIRDGLMIEKAVSDNPRLLHLNVEYNDLDFKVLTEIHHLVKVNQRLWRQNQGKRIEEAVIKMAEAEGQLVEVRTLIKEERATIADLQDKLAATQEGRRKTEEDKATHIANLEQKLSDVTDQVDLEITNQRDAQLEMRGQLSKLESEHAAITNKNDREVMNFQRECKALRNCEKEMEEVQANKGKGEIDWGNDLLSAKMKYKDVQQMFENAFQALQEQRNQAALAEAAATAAEERAKNAKPARRGKKKGKKKDDAPADEAKTEGEGEEAKPAEEGGEAKPAEEGTATDPAKAEEPAKAEDLLKPPEEELLVHEPSEPKGEGSLPGSQNRNSVQASWGSRPGTADPDAPAPAAQTLVGKGRPKIVKPSGSGTKSARRANKA
jgi:Leucine-rich repeat (LRR) protein